MPSFVAEFFAVSKLFRTGLVRRKMVCALRDLTFSVPRGSVFGVIGPNRAGKTTLVKILLGLCRPTSGRIVRLGRPAEVRSTLAHVGYLHESQAFPQYLSASALLRYYGSLSPVSRHDLNIRIPRLLDEVGLADRAKDPIVTFSKGMSQRLALAQALLNDPELLVLDEPAEGMDFLARKLLDEVIHRRKREGKSSILVSHSVADVQRLCDAVAVLRQGALAFCGSLAELLQDETADRSPEALQEALEPLYEGACP